MQIMQGVGKSGGFGDIVGGASDRIIRSALAPGYLSKEIALLHSLGATNSLKCNFYPESVSDLDSVLRVHFLWSFKEFDPAYVHINVRITKGLMILIWRVFL